MLLLASTLMVCTCSNKQESNVTAYHLEKIFIGDEYKDPYLKLHIPDGYTIGRKKGPDFMLFFAKPVDTAGLQSKATLNIYIGHHPNPIYPDGEKIDLTENDVGTRYTWTSWMEKKNDRHTIVTDAMDKTLLEGVMPKTFMGSVYELQLHFFINATDKKIARLLMRSAESVELVKQE